ncbi:type IX secretion system membrane protein PorP/SprF [Arenibacter sp. F26102]|uniref:PorP/SprF family type IX secretion system membrane protein n=1 Tax=Arenibacter sp. F26102 TaxID=2926416 RepID=UPI001FF49A89|nr:type IX secretion system membrane protein PorP/SprF [Arenibacter sp. F26102]MCK0145293.1 type IX secretion system membrane protein PorP/SprF [Arenibacter sp. F26102]
MKYLPIILIACTTLFGFTANAQQDPHFTLYRYNMNIINPAYAGANETTDAIFGVRSQWSGVQGGPETQTFNLSSPLGNNLGAGISVVNDKVFVLGETHLYADFSYKLKLSETLKLYAGLKAGGTFLDVNLSETGITNDPLFTSDVSKFSPNVGLGFYLKAEKYYVTLSAPGILSNDRYEKDGTTPVAASDDLVIFAGGGYDFELSDSFKLRPSVLSRITSGAPVSIDLTGSFLYEERFELGGNYRIDESLAIFATVGLLDNKINFGYAYEFSTSEFLSTNNDGTHELILKFQL